MAVMLAVTLPAWVAASTVSVFALGVAWCAVHLVRGSRPAAHVRLGVSCLAMLAMALPSSGGAPSAMGPGSMQAHPTSSTGPGVAVVVLAGVLVCLAVSGAARGVRASWADGTRAAGLAEGLLAAAMAAMLVGVV
jgi:hypothetical protein